MRVGFDLDGVLYDFGQSVQEYGRSLGQEFLWKDDYHEPHNWNFFEHWGWDYSQFKAFCNDGADAGYIFCGDARPNAVSVVQAVAAMGHEVIIITDRQFGSHPSVSHRNTEEWLAQHKIPFDELWFSADKTCAHTDLFVEDKLENYDALVAHGTPTYLINRAWNQVPGGDARNRINDISDYLDAIVAIDAQGYADLTFA